MFNDFELCQNSNYLGKIFRVLCVALAEFSGNNCLSKLWYAIICFFFL